MVKNRNENIIHQMDDLQKIITNKNVSDYEKGICNLAYWTGARLAEVVQIMIAIKAGEKEAVLVKGKGGIIYKAILKDEWLTYFESVDWDNTYINYQSIRKMIYRLEDKVGFKVSMHGFRRGIASDCRLFRIPTEMVQNLLNHANLKTTQLYQKKVSRSNDVREIYSMLENGINKNLDLDYYKKLSFQLKEENRILKIKIGGDK